MLSCSPSRPWPRPTRSPGATLDLTMIRPRSVCLECGHEFEHDLYNRFCPVCDSFATELLAGRELQIDSIEVDLPEE